MNIISTITETQKEIIEEFNYFDNWLDRYEYIIELGKQLPEFPPALQTAENHVSGCQAQVWLHSQLVEHKLYFNATSDAFIVKGLAALLLKLYSGRTPQEILQTKADFVKAIGLDNHLSPTRSNGLYYMLKKINHYAEQYQ